MIHDQNRTPSISIIIVNFNGRHLLDSCLKSLLAVSYPAKKVQIIVVDNNSTDDSIAFLMKSYKNKVEVVQNEENLGFTGGNIEGLKIATGDYIILLNSDVVVDKKWLNALVKKAQDPKVGIISSRLRFALPFIELEITSPAIPKSKIFHTIDHSPIGVIIEDVVCESNYLSELVYYKSGFYEKKTGDIVTRCSSGVGKILLPMSNASASSTFQLTLHALNFGEPQEVKIAVNGVLLKKLTLKPNQTIQIPLKISTKKVAKSLIWLVQNAGNILLANGYGKDRGSVVIVGDVEQREFYEEESSFYLKDAEISAACGASCLIKREVIDSIGFLNGTYFMYYEDMEYCIRAWRAGWKVVYAADAIGYHQHRATTGIGESAFFLHLVERNHLSFVITHFPLSTVFSEIFSFALRFAITTLKAAVFQFRDNEERANTWRKKYAGRKLAFIFLLQNWWQLWNQRVKIEKLWPMNYQKFHKILY